MGRFWLNASIPAQLPHGWLVSTNQSHLSMPRAISVKMRGCLFSRRTLTTSITAHPIHRVARYPALTLYQTGHVYDDVPP
jgi:hypothetical protein